MKIKKLRIVTKDIEKQLVFYTQLLGLSLTDSTKSSITLNVGKTQLELVSNQDFKPYHFAINIPNNKVTEALCWLKARVDILKCEGEEIKDFIYWNAKSIYFYDEDYNIVELIARKNLCNESFIEFNSSSFLEISEIGMAVENIKQTFDVIHDISPLGKYDGGFEQFLAIGDEEGMFICVNKKLKKWYPTGDTAFSSNFDITFCQHDKAYSLIFENGSIKGRL